jgi:hypothetical protein
MALNIVIMSSECHYAEFVNNPIMVTVVELSVVKSNAIMPIVVLLSAVVPF